MKILSILALSGLVLVSSSRAHALGECLPTTPKANTSVLRGAVYSGKLKVVAACLKMGVDQDTIAFMEAVQTAILEAKLEILKTILDWDPTVVLRELKDSTFPLHVASRIYPGFSGIEKERYEALELILSYNPDVKAADSRGWTPLHMAARACNPKLIEKYLGMGADPDAADTHLVTPLKQLSVDCTTTMLLPHDESVIDGMVLKAVKSLLDRGALTETQDNLGGTVLHQLARRSRVAAAKLVIQSGADVNAENQSGCRPLDYAKASTRNSGAKPKMISLLKSKGAQAGADCELGF
jgi:ankyrin repeat protein